MLAPTICCCGELLVDRTPDGKETPGGAPANVAAVVAALGARAGLISRVADDSRGRELVAWLQTQGINGELTEFGAPAATGLVEVVHEANGPAYDIVAPAAWDFINLGESGESFVRRSKIFVCGTLAQRHPDSRRTIRRAAEMVKSCGGLVLIDFNLRPPFYDEETIIWCLRHAEVLKLSVDELTTVSSLLGTSGSPEDLLCGLMREFNLPRVILTVGGEGAWFMESGELLYCSARNVEVVDAIGCGDAVSAVAAVFLAHDQGLAQAAPWCMEVGGFVATQAGATPALPDDLVRRVREAVQS